MQILKFSQYFDQEILEMLNKYSPPAEFKNALNKLNAKMRSLYQDFNISSLSYHHLEHYNLMKIKLKIIGISKNRLQKNKQYIANVTLPNYVYKHSPGELLLP